MGRGVSTSSPVLCTYDCTAGCLQRRLLAVPFGQTSGLKLLYVNLPVLQFEAAALHDALRLRVAWEREIALTAQPAHELVERIAHAIRHAKSAPFGIHPERPRVHLDVDAPYADDLPVHLGNDRRLVIGRGKYIAIRFIDLAQPLPLFFWKLADL